MQKLICTLLVFTSSTCFAHFGPGPGGGSGNDAEKVEKENAAHLIVDETPVVPSNKG